MTFTWLIFVIQAIFSSIFLMDLTTGSIPIIIVSITSIFLLFDFARHDFLKSIFIILFLSYLLRLFLMFFDLYGQDIFVLPNSGLDSEMFHGAAINGLATGHYGNGHIYSFVIGILYSFFGQERLLAQFFNVLLSMHAIILVYKTMELYQIGDKIKYLALSVIALLPNFAIMSSILLRESIIIFLYVLSFYCFSQWFVKNSTMPLILSYLFGLLVAVFHSGSIILVVAYTVILILYDPIQERFNLNLKSILIAVTFLLVFLFLFQNYFDIFFFKFSNIGDVGDVTDIYVMGESGYTTGFALENPLLNLIVNTPLRIFSFVLSPLPWHWRGVADIIAFLFSSLFYGSILYLGFKSVFMGNTPNKNMIIGILLIVVIGLVVFAWGVSNAGTALRHRDKFIGLFILLFALIRHDEIVRRKAWERK